MNKIIFFLLYFFSSIVFGVEEKGYVYILTNSSTPSQMKVGYTKDIVRRIDELYTTSVVQPYRLYFAKKFSTAKRAYIIEQKLHAQFDAYRINPKREFFKKKVICEVKEALEQYRGKAITPAFLEEMFLSAKGIKKKDQLIFKKNPSIIITIEDKYCICYNKRKYTLKTLTEKLIGKQLRYQTVFQYWKVVSRKK